MPVPIGLQALDDESLVRAVRAGDPGAFEALYQRHAPAVRAAAFGKVRHRERAEDVVQTTFLRALERLDALRDPTKLRGWLLTIARNVALDELRRNSRVELDEDAGDDVAASGSVDVQVEVAELGRLVHGALSGLTERDVTAVAMAGYLNASPEEIGERLGVSPGAAKVALHRARKRLRTAMKLELLVRAGEGCPELRPLAEAGDLPRAGNHVSRCDVCQRAGSTAIRLYQGATASGARITVSVLATVGGTTRLVPVVDRLVIGRECDGVDDGQRVLLDDPSVSRTHVELRVDAASGRAFAIDASSNGTLRNGERLPTGEAVALAHGDRLSVGAATFDVAIEALEVAEADGPTTALVVAVAAVSGPEADRRDVVRTLRRVVRTFGGSGATWDPDRCIAYWDAADAEGADLAVAAAGLATALALPSGCRLGWGIDLGPVRTEGVGPFAVLSGAVVDRATRLAVAASEPAAPSRLLVSVAGAAAATGHRFVDAPTAVRPADAARIPDGRITPPGS